MSGIKELIKSVFGEQPEKEAFASATLENGQVIEAESFEPGNEVFLRTEDGLIPLPEGEYDLEDGSKIMVSAEGQIAEFQPGAAPAEEEMQTEEMAAEEAAPEYVTKEDFEKFKTEVLSGVELLATEMSKVEKEKTELSEGAQAELDQLKSTLHKKRSLNKEEDKNQDLPLPKTREVRNKYVDQTVSRIRENNEKFVKQ